MLGNLILLVLLLGQADAADVPVAAKRFAADSTSQRGSVMKELQNRVKVEEATLRRLKSATINAKLPADSNVPDDKRKPAAFRTRELKAQAIAEAQKNIEAARKELTDSQADGQPPAPFLSYPLEIGQLGRLEHRAMDVMTVIDPSSATGKVQFRQANGAPYKALVTLTGIPTGDMADGRAATMPGASGLFQVIAIDYYKNAQGNPMPLVTLEQLTPEKAARLIGTVGR